MQAPLQIGITGGIGSGKSLICKIFHCLGVPVYDADSRAKYIMTTDGILIDEIKKEFGELSFNGNTLNRAYISKVVFEDPEKLKVLNGLVHPRVASDYINWMTQQTHCRYVLKEAALMFEAKSNQMLDKIIVVSAPEALRIERVLKRDVQRTHKQVDDIIRNQLPEEEKLKQADFVIVNDEMQFAIPQVLELHERFSNAEIFS